MEELKDGRREEGGRVEEGWKGGRGERVDVVEYKGTIKDECAIKEAQSNRMCYKRGTIKHECATTSQCFCFVKEAWDVV